MQQGQASRTAEFMALFRALESARPPEGRLFQDPFAQDFLRPSLRAVVTVSRVPGLRELVPWLIDWRWPGARPSGIARTRLIDDALVAALGDGIDQVAILGAGFDCRAYRLSGLDRTRVFEVDRPRTLAVKRGRLRRRLGALPAHVAFVAVDLDRQGLGEALLASGFDVTRRSFFVWEGVTNYLTERAVDATLRFLGTVAPGSQVLFTYVHRGVLVDPAQFAGTRRLVRTLGRTGEVWTFGLDPCELPGFLEARGLRLIEDIGSLEYRARYLRPGRRALEGYAFYRAVRARVGCGPAAAGRPLSASPQG
jgi:methyltransferase (TIGR00027 family)